MFDQYDISIFNAYVFVYWQRHKPRLFFALFSNVYVPFVLNLINKIIFKKKRITINQ